MRKKFRRQISRAATWSPRLGWLAVLVLIITILCHNFALIDARMFFIGATFGGIMALISVSLAVQGFTDLWTHGDKGGRAAIKGVILSVIALAPFMLAAMLWLSLPSVYDVSSDVDNPPHLPSTATRPLTALPVLEDFSGQANKQIEVWPDLSGRRYDSSPDRILNAVETVLETQGWPVQIPVVKNAEEGEIVVAAIIKLPILGFVSDIIIRLRDDDEATRVDMRVTSRDLHHDFGFGAHTILTFMLALDREILLAGMEQREED